MKDPVTSQPAEYKTGGGSAMFILVVCTLLYVANYIDRQVFSVVLQPMKIELGLTDTQCGMAQTIFILGMALFSFPVAYLVDRWSRNKTIGIMALLWSIFTFLTGFAKNFTTLIIPRSLVGVGESGFTAGGVAMVSAAYPPEKRARMLGIFNIGIPLGAAIGMIAGGAISAAMGWRWAFYIFAIPGIILGILAFFMRDYKTPASTGMAGARMNFGKVHRSVVPHPQPGPVFLRLRYFVLYDGVRAGLGAGADDAPDEHLRGHGRHDRGWMGTDGHNRRPAGRLAGRRLAEEDRQRAGFTCRHWPRYWPPSC